MIFHVRPSTTHFAIMALQILALAENVLSAVAACASILSTTQTPKDIVILYAEPPHEGLSSVARRRSFLRPQDTTEDDTTEEETQVPGIPLQEAEEAKDMDKMKTE
jgi:hypothetical protein